MKLYRILILTLCAYALISCGGAEERKAVYMEKAKSSIEAGDLEKARVELKNVLQIDPKDGEAYYYLGTVFEQKEDYRKAYGYYIKAEELDPNLLANQARLGRIYLLLANDIEKSQEKIDFILSKDPDDLNGLLLKAVMMLKNKNEAGALDIAKAVVDKEPGHIDGVIFLARLHSVNNDNEEAIALLDNALKTNLNNKKLSELLGRILVKSENYVRAEVIYKQLQERNPDDRNGYRVLAAFYNTSGDEVKVEETLRASIISAPDDIERYYDLIKYLSVSKGNEEAINELKNFIVKNKGMGGLRIGLAEYLLINGEQELAIDIYKEAVSDFSEEKTGIDARVALASIYIRNKAYADASNVIEEAITISANDPKVNLLRAKLAIHNNDIEKAIISLRIVTKETPDNIEAYLLLANTYQLENNNEQVKATLNSAYDNNKGNSDALLKLARFYLAQDIDLAEKIIDDYNVLKKSDYDGLSIKAAILNQKKLPSEAHKLAEKLMELYPDKPNGYLQAVPYYGQTGDTQEAINVLEKGYLSVKDNRKILILLTTLQVTKKEFDIAVERIKKELKASPDDIGYKVLLAKVYLASNDTDSTEAILIKIIEDAPSIEEPYLMLLRIYQIREDKVSIKSILEKGKNNIPSSSKIALRLAALYELEKDYEKAINIYEELNKLEPDDLIVANNLASLLSDYGDGVADLEKAKALIDTLDKSDKAPFLDTIGWIYYKLGDYTNAALYLSKAVEKAPEINVFNFHLGMTYKMLGDNVQAKIFLEKCLANKQDFQGRDLAKSTLLKL